QRGEYAKALEYYQQALDMRQKLYNKPHPDVASSLYNIGIVYTQQREYARALKYYDEALNVLRRSSANDLLVFAQFTPGLLMPLPLTPAILHRRALVLEATLGTTPTPAQLRVCEQTYALAASILERVRQETLQRDESKLLHGAREAFMVPRHLGICWRLFEA